MRTLKISENIHSHQFGRAVDYDDVICNDSVHCVPAFAFFSSHISSFTHMSQTGGFCIESRAFGQCKCLKTVTVHSDDVKLMTAAFHRCYSLSAVDLQDVSYVGEEVFRDCHSLLNVNIQSSYPIQIGAHAFSRCMSMSSISLPNSVTSICTYAFAECESLDEINVPVGVQSIDAYAFAGCVSLRNVIIANNNIWIDDHAFDGCNNIMIKKS